MENMEHDFRQAVKGVLDVLSAIDKIKQELGEEITAIEADTSRSGNWKLSQICDAKEAAHNKLLLLSDSMEPYIDELKKAAEKIVSAFDYSNPKLTGAVAFVSANGKELPESAWRQMIADFSARPAELRYLATMFERYGVVDAAMEAKERAGMIGIDSTFADRVNDAVYYAVSLATDAHTDLSGLRNEVKIYGEKLQAAIDA